MQRIKYLGYYDVLANKDQCRYYPLSAANKMSYIITALEAIGYGVDVISISATDGKKYCKGKKTKLYENSTLKLFPSLPRTNLIMRLLRVILIKMCFFVYLLFTIKKDDKIIVYHSLGYIGLIKLLKKIKKFTLILEMEEIYSDVIGDSSKLQSELDLCKMADAFIFPVELLNEKLNKSAKPHAIIYGAYNLEKKFASLFNDGKTHAVYAGTFDPTKGSCLAAKAAEFLDEKYHVHIIGFGTPEEKDDLIKLIELVSKKTNCTLTYDGLKSGDEYTAFLQSCDIGLSTQQCDAAYNETSFPSKILSYLSNGLEVVSVKINVLEKSKISSLLHYYSGSDAKSVANAIKSIDLSQKKDIGSAIKELDSGFKKDMAKLLKKLEA